MTARFLPRGLLGILYWYAVVPLHEFVFGGMLSGIQKTAEAMQRSKTMAGSEPPVAESAPGYGRARLWLGMTGVGTMVVLAAAGLAYGLPARLLPAADKPLGSQIAALAGFVLAYAAVHLPFDLFGGYLLPRRYGRRHLPLAVFCGRLARGVGVHSALMLLTAAVLLLAGRAGGAAGVIAAAVALIVTLLQGRIALAAALAPLDVTPSLPLADDEPHPGDTPVADALPTFMGESDDEAFTGAVLGVTRPQLHLLPMRWKWSITATTRQNGC